METDKTWLEKPYSFAVMLIIVLLSLGYQIKLAWEQAIPLEHDNAVAWQWLIDGYDAIKQKQAPAELLTLKNQEVTLYGFMFPIEPSEKHQQFLLLSHSASCPFHQLLGQGNVVEVTAQQPIKYQRAPVLIKGHFIIDDTIGADIQYRLHDAILLTP